VGWIVVSSSDYLRASGWSWYAGSMKPANTTKRVTYRDAKTGRFVSNKLAGKAGVIRNVGVIRKKQPVHSGKSYPLRKRPERYQKPEVSRQERVYGTSTQVARYWVTGSMSSCEYQCSVIIRSIKRPIRESTISVFAESGDDKAQSQPVEWTVGKSVSGVVRNVLRGEYRGGLLRYEGNNFGEFVDSFDRFALRLDITFADVSPNFKKTVTKRKKKGK